MQVVIQNPASGRVAGLLVLGPAGLLGGVGTEQVVAAIAAGRVLSEQVGPGELAEGLPGLGGCHPGQAGGGQRADVGPGMQAEQPEHPGGSGARAAGRTRRTRHGR